MASSLPPWSVRSSRTWRNGAARTTRSNCSVRSDSRCQVHARADHLSSRRVLLYQRLELRARLPGCRLHPLEKCLFQFVHFAVGEEELLEPGRLGGTDRAIGQKGLLDDVEDELVELLGRSCRAVSQIDEELCLGFVDHPFRQKLLRDNVGFLLADRAVLEDEGLAKSLPVGHGVFLLGQRYFN